MRDFQLKMNQKLFVGRVLPGNAGRARREQGKQESDRKKKEKEKSREEKGTRFHTGTSFRHSQPWLLWALVGMQRVVCEMQCRPTCNARPYVQYTSAFKSKLEWVFQRTISISRFAVLESSNNTKKKLNSWHFYYIMSNSIIVQKNCSTIMKRLLRPNGILCDIKISREAPLFGTPSLDGREKCLVKSV